VRERGRGEGGIQRILLGGKWPKVAIFQGKK